MKRSLGPFFLTLVLSVNMLFAQEPANYCTPINTGCLSTYSGIIITSVSFNSLLNVTGDTCMGNGYKHYSATTSVEKGAAYLMHVNGNGISGGPAECCVRPTQSVYAWIDFNQNGSFNDSGERFWILWDQYAGEAMIPIPTTALTGPTRMRLMNSGVLDPPNPCTGVGSGYESEDYTITILPANTGLASCPNYYYPTSGDTKVSRNPTLQWSGASGGTLTTYNLYFGTTVDNLTPIARKLSGNSFALPMLLNASTTYYYKIEPVNNNGATADCSVQNFTPIDSLEYCMPVSGTSMYRCMGYISNVSLNTLNHTSSCTGERPFYAYFSPSDVKTTTLLKGSSYPITITTGFGSTNCFVFFDFNQNGSFSDPGETMQIGPSGTYWVFSGNVMIPSDIPTGKIRMRIRSADGNSPCADSYYGEAKDYMITIEDAPACATLKGSYNKTDVIGCWGDSTGAINLAINGGTLPYTVSWTAPIAVAGNTISNLPAGVYQAKVTDAANCTYSTPAIQILQPFAKLSVAYTKQNAQCTGTDNGAIELFIQGGTSPYQVSWSDPLLSGVSTNNVLPGNYSAVITDDHNCTVSSTLISINSFQTNYTSTPESCKGYRNGSIALHATGGQAPYSYSWVGRANTSASVSGLTPGSYTATIQDADGCAHTISSMEVAGASSALSGDLAATNLHCGGYTNLGSLTATPAGGMPPYTFQWAGVSTKTSTLSNVAIGSYTCKIIDSFGCSYTTNGVYISKLSPPVGTGASRCTPGTVQLSAIYGSLFNWYDDSLDSTPLGTGPSFTTPYLSQTDTFYVAATNATGQCESDRIPVVAKLLLSSVPAKPYAGKDTSLCGAQTISLHASAGTGTYKWYRASGMAAISGASPSVRFARTDTLYLVTSNGICESASDTLVIQVSPAPPVMIHADSIVSGGNDLSLCGGDSVLLKTSKPYASYSWRRTNTVVGTDSFLYVKTSGIYRVQVTENNCVSDFSDVVGIFQYPSNPSIYAADSNIIYSGSPDTIRFCNNNTIALNAPSEAYTWYGWYKDGVLLNTDSTIHSWQASSSGNYTLHVKDGKCISGSSTKAILKKEVLLPPVISNDLSAPLGDTLLKFCATIAPAIVLNGSPGYLEYEWSKNGAVVQSTPTITATDAGSYRLRVKNSYCQSDFSLPVSLKAVPEKPMLYAGGMLVDKDTLWFCGQDSLLLNATEGYHWYQWTNNGTILSVDTSLQTITIKNEGSFSVQVKDSSLNCLSEVSDQVITRVFASPPTPAIIKGTDDSLICTSEAVLYQWKCNDTILAIQSKGFVPDKSGSYTVAVYDDNFCGSSLSAPFTFSLTISATKEQVMATLSVTCHPNPTTGIITLESNSTENFFIQILNGQGAVVQTGMFSKNINLDLSTLSSGIYFLNITGENARKVVKVMKND